MRRSGRFDRLPPYPFARQAEKIASLQARGMDVIRMDIGSPDQPPAGHILRALESAARRPDAHGYPPNSYGSPSFLEAIAGYYRNRFGVTLDPRSETTVLLGSKEGIFHIQQAFLETGDVALVPDPGYPVYRVAAEWAGAEVWPLPLRADHDYLPRLETIPADVLKRAKLLWLNYPNNPTGAVAEPEFFAQAVEFARRNGILICHDAAYCDVAFDGYRPGSILQVPGAKEVAVEFASLSKAYNMAGWRAGMLVGNAEGVLALRKLKSNVDSGMFIPVMEAGEAALRGDQSWLGPRNELYARRRDIVLAGLRAIGIAAPKPKASLYIWAPIPVGWTAEAFSDEILETTGVCFSPGTFFGGEGEGYLRISLGTATARMEEGMRRLAEKRAAQPGWLASPENAARMPRSS